MGGRPAWRFAIVAGSGSHAHVGKCSATQAAVTEPRCHNPKTLMRIIFPVFVPNGGRGRKPPIVSPGRGSSSQILLAMPGMVCLCLPGLAAFIDPASEWELYYRKMLGLKALAPALVLTPPPIRSA